MSMEGHHLEGMEQALPATYAIISTLPQPPLCHLLLYITILKTNTMPSLQIIFPTIIVTLNRPALDKAI